MGRSGTKPMHQSDLSALVGRKSMPAGITTALLIFGLMLAAPSVKAAPPGPPSIASVTPGNGQMQVAFTAPVSNGGSPITAYIATCANRSAMGTASPISVIGLINQAAVQCSVLARNASGDGPASALSAAQTVGDGSVHAYIPRLGQANVAVFNTLTGGFFASIGLGSGQTGVAASPDGARVYVANQAGNQVTVINTQTRAVVGSITVGANPWSAAVSPDSTRVYVSNSGENTVSEIDALTNTVVRTHTVFNRPLGVAVSPDGKQVYVANSGTNAISVINTETQQVLGPFTAAMDPSALAVSPDGKRLYVASISQNLVAVLDTSNFSVIGSVGVGTSPNGVVVSRDSQRVYVSNYNGSSVSVINPHTLTETTTIGVGGGPYGIDVSPDDQRIYVASTFANTLTVIDASNFQVAGTYNLGASSTPYAAGRFISSGGVAPASSNASLINARVGQAYNELIPVSGHPLPSLSLITNTLPPGLSFDATTRRVVGTPTTAGNYLALFRMSNGVGSPGDATVQLNVLASRPAPPTITQVTPGNQQVLVVFDPPSSDGGAAVTFYNVFCDGAFFVGAGPTSPITVQVPNGLPTRCRATAINSAGASDASEFSATVIPGVLPELQTDPLPTAYFGQPYNTTISATGAPTPSLRLSAGTLPDGMSFDAATGTLSGTPLQVAEALPVVLTFEASNALGTVTRNFDLTVRATVPSAPYQLQAEGNNGVAVIRFSVPMLSGGAPVLDYTVGCQPGDISASGLSSPINVALVNDQIYSCRVSARNRVGAGPASVPVRVLPRSSVNTNLGISIDNDTDAVNAGVPIQYQIMVTNTGAAGVLDARVQSELGPDFVDLYWTCQALAGATCPDTGHNGEIDLLADLFSGGSLLIELTATPAFNAETAVNAVVRVSAPADSVDTDPSNNVATDGPDWRGIFRNDFE